MDLWRCCISQVARRFVLGILADGVIDVVLHLDVCIVTLVSILVLRILSDASATTGVTTGALGWISRSVGC